MLVNIIGPPAAGKSSMATKYVLEHPTWSYISIDACRIEEQDENEAWRIFEKRIKESKLLIAESSGLSWRLPSILARLDARPIMTLAMIASPTILHLRLSNRQNKRELPYRLRMDEHDSIDWVLQNLDNIEYPIAEYIHTEKYSKDELYELVSEKIRQFRLTGERENNVI